MRIISHFLITGGVRAEGFAAPVSNKYLFL
jgi:hypothetical protein